MNQAPTISQAENGAWPHFIDRKYLHGIDIHMVFLDRQ